MEATGLMGVIMMMTTTIVVVETLVDGVGRCVTRLVRVWWRVSP